MTKVDGCDCGGLDWHRRDCMIWDRPAADRIAAISAARAREQDFTAALNARLREG